jgi:transposase
MNCSAAILSQWRREDPDRLLQAALSQAERLALMAPEVEALRAENASLHQQLEVTTKRIAQLEEALEAALGAAHRQAAPFRIEPQKRAVAPKRPGRKRGHPGAFRHKPDHLDEDIEVELCSCPHCGGTQFKDQNAIEQLIEDILPVRPHVTRLTTYQGTCVGCGQSVRSKHPLQMSLAIGAAGVHLGPRALAVAADLNKAKGLPMRKTCAVLLDCFGLQLSSGGLSQALDRLAAKVKPQYDAIAAELRRAPSLHSDETGWWVAGPGWWLWVFTTQLLTFYVVAQSRGREFLSDILGKDFGGVLVSDCLAVYDDATALQHKCYAHHHKAIRKAKALTLNRVRASYAKWRQCCVPLSHSNSKKLSLARKPSVICVEPSNAKPFNCWSLPAANLTKKPCAIGSINSAIISLPFWITTALMPPIIWPNANCAQR